MDIFETSLGLGAWLAIGSMALLYNHYPVTPITMIAIPFASVLGIYIGIQTSIWLAFAAYYTLTVMFHPDILITTMILLLITVATYTIVSIAYLVQEPGFSLPRAPLPVGGSSCED
jgi:hypothetical protein